jgi:hypothetical protein
MSQDPTQTPIQDPVQDQTQATVQTPSRIGGTLFQRFQTFGSTLLGDRISIGANRRETLFDQATAAARAQLYDTPIRDVSAELSRVDTTGQVNDPNTLDLNGEVLDLNDEPDQVSNLHVGCLFDPAQRHLMTADQLIEFRQNATKTVLRKRLCQTNTSDKDENMLENVCNLELQITAIIEHLRTFGMMNVFSIVFPDNARRSKRLLKPCCNLFEHYVSLDPAIVAASILYYHLWVKNSYVRENMSLTYTFLRNNTEDTLWAKCLSIYETYPEDCRGGPLMFHLLMQRIQSSTEHALTHLVDKIRKFKISSIDGENVETVVLHVKAALKLVGRGAQTDVVRLPHDFPKILFGSLSDLLGHGVQRPFPSSVG